MKPKKASFFQLAQTFIAGFAFAYGIVYVLNHL